MKHKVTYHQRNGCSVYSLDGQPMTIEDECHYGIEMRRARELYFHRQEMVAKLPAWWIKLCKRFQIRAVTQYL